MDVAYRCISSGRPGWTVILEIGTVLGEVHLQAYLGGQGGLQTGEAGHVKLYTRWSRGWEMFLQWKHLLTQRQSQTSNFKARYLYGNIKRVISNIHVNIRSLYNKMSEVKNFILQEKPHILERSETELRKSYHNLNKLKVPGYELLLPNS